MAAKQNVAAPVRAVFDCNVLLQAMAHAAGHAGACLQAVRDGRITLCASRDLFAELANVVTRPAVVRKLCLTPTGTESFLNELRSLSAMFEDVPEAYRHPLDPKDSMIVNLAVAATAHVITSRDRHLLDLRDIRTPLGADFVSRFSSIEILTPVELLTRVRSE